MTPIYVPESVAVSCQDVLDDINMRLDNDLEPKSSEFTGDGIAEILHLPDRAVCPLPNAPLVYKVIGAGAPTVLIESADYTVDYQAGYVTLLTDHVDEGTTLYVDYKTRHWSEQLLWRLVNNGLHYLYPRFYAIVEITPTIGGDGDYPLLDNAERIIGGIIDVEDVSDSGISHLTPFRDYRVVRKEDEDAYLRLFTSAQGTVTVRAAVHPLQFLAPATTFADLGLPERMREPLTLYVCWQAINQKMPARSRWDNITGLNNEGKTTFFDHARMVQMFKLLLDEELKVNHMRHWTAKGL